MILKTRQVNSYRRTAICSCDYCKKEFRRSYLHAKRSIKNFCNAKCQYKFYQSVKAKKVYLESRNRISLSKLGDKNPMYGKKYTAEEKRNLGRKSFRNISRNKTKYRMAADKLWSRIILSVGHCEICNKTQYLNPHHIIGRKNMTLRFDLLNGICLCAGCHILKIQSAHQDPLWFNEWLLKQYPDRIEYINKKKNDITKRTYDDYEKLVEELRIKDPTYDK